VTYRDETRVVIDDLHAWEELRYGLAALAQVARAVAAEEPKTGRPPARPEHAFVKALADVFRDYTGKEPTVTRNAYADTGRDRIAGRFATFVKAVENFMIAEIARRVGTIRDSPDATNPMFSEAQARDLAERYRLRSLVSVISEVVRARSSVESKNPGE
jgi:hypothetical protein